MQEMEGGNEKKKKKETVAIIFVSKMYLSLDWNRKSFFRVATKYIMLDLRMREMGKRMDGINESCRNRYIELIISLHLKS